MSVPVEDQVVELFAALFESIFSAPFRAGIAEKRKSRAVIRQVDEAADAASQSLSRFLKNEKLPASRLALVLEALRPLGDLLSLEDLSSTYTNPEDLAIRPSEKLDFQASEGEKKPRAIFRESVHSVVQVLLLVGPVMAEWQRLRFATTFELPRRIVDRLNQISAQLELLGRAEPALADERFELGYRDYLLQRFFRIEAGTVRMTTNLAIDLRALFVMPRVRSRGSSDASPGSESEARAPIKLAEARARFSGKGMKRASAELPLAASISALEKVLEQPRNVLIGVPGIGKSTFLEWVQLQLASADVELVSGGQQAIPLLLRVRQLDTGKLPIGAVLIEKATASPDRARIMPRGWIDRQVTAGRAFFMIDGLDEIDPGLREQQLIPWVRQLCESYPDCRFLISSRPLGYTRSSLEGLGFHESELQDFDDPQITEFTRHWCTAVRLARNEPQDEARREGGRDGDRIVGGFKENPYVRDLARNPLMLSAICLVDYFEGGQLPQDRCLLYRLCVEGLLHHWDQRRGIHSEFGLAEKLRVCREVALAMQVEDRAECEADKVKEIFQQVFPQAGRADRLFEHIRQRTGLLVERRPEILAFAHLTFQEYLAAAAVLEGNLRGVRAEQLAEEHTDTRWSEVIALYCGLAPEVLGREMIARLLDQPDTIDLEYVLVNVFYSAVGTVREDKGFHRRVTQRIEKLRHMHRVRIVR